MTLPYQPQGFALDIFQKRHAIHDKETWLEASGDRVPGHVAAAETGDNIARYKAAFADVLTRNLFMPGGRIWYGSGRPKGQLLNCFVSPTADSREGWGRTTSDMIVICGTGGGLGNNFSPVRPRGAPIHGTGGKASGSVSLMRIVNAAGEEMKAGGGRRTALMFALGLTHGDIVEFLDAKLDLGQLNNANVSVVFDDNPELFFEKVRNNEQLELTFRGQVIGKVPAVFIWNKIIKNALTSGEPGLLNGYLANRMSNIWYYKPLICTNPCFAPGTMIQTRDGRRQIETLVGRTVDVWDGQSWVSCDNFRVTGENQEMLRITMEDGSYERVTPYHSCILEDGTRVEARNLKAGMRLKYGSAWSLKRPSNIVEEIQKDGIEEKVYCCTIPSTHSLLLSSGIMWGQCGEIWLIEYDCCCLGALVLPRFVTDNGLDWALLRSTVHTSVRFLDDVLTVNNYPLPEIQETCSSIRRIGLGIMGLHDMLLMMGQKYNTPQSLELVDKLMAFIKNEAYEASVDLAKEKGAFPEFDAEKFLKSGFAKTLKPTLRSKIREFGIRNCALLTIAPTGTTSMECDVTSGIEPAFGPAWKRRYRDGDELKEEIVIHPLFKRFIEEGRDVSHFQSAYDLAMRDHFEMQAVCQRHLDNACSKTINVPAGTSAEELSDLYMEFFPVLKGVTVYPEGSRENQPITPMTYEDAMKHLDATGEGALSGDTCRIDGTCG